MARLLSRAEMAEELRVTTREINNLVREGMPRVLLGTRVRYSPGDCQSWYRDRNAQQLEARLGGPKAKMVDLQARKLEVEARRAELELAREEGSLVSIEYLEQQMEAVLQQLRSKLRNVPGQYATQLVGIKTVGESQIQLQRLVTEVMTVLADSGAEAELDDESEGAVA